MKLLDCTLRDGGYYNNWDFEFSLVREYLQTMQQANIDYVELGLRQFQQPRYLGAFAYTPESLLSAMDLPDGPKYGVMVDAKTVLNSQFSSEETIKKLFIDASESKLSLVRIAAHPFEVPHCKIIVHLLTEMGYEVGLNIMQISTLIPEDIHTTALLINSWSVKPNVLYFADSLGSMEPDDISKIIDSLCLGWDGAMGFHAHNNQGIALQNAKKCLTKNVEWIDATITGMGRGAGNLTMEDVFLNIHPDPNEFSSQSIFKLANSSFKNLQDQYNYGPNLLYRIAAKHSIHPTFIQRLLSDPSVDTFTHLDVIKRISHLSEPNKYTSESYQRCIGLSANSKSENDKTAPPFGNIADIKKGRDFLILGSGASSKNIIDLIPILIKQQDLVSISVNHSSCYLQNSDFLCALPNNNMLAENKSYDLFSNSIITPKKFKGSKLGSKLFACADSVLHFDYSLADAFLFSQNGLESKFDLSAAYAIAASISMGAEKIFFIGFDGYPHPDYRYLQMVEVLKYFQEIHGTNNLISLTQTKYPVTTESVYGYLA